MQIFIFKKYISGEKGHGRTRMRVEIVRGDVRAERA
jgi:hypothetical protein